MDNFWDQLIQGKIKDDEISKNWNGLSQHASFRPTIYIGVGGFGCGVIRNLKQEIDKIIPYSTIKEGFAFIGLDTHPRDVRDILTQSEYLSLSLGINPNQIVNDPHFSKTMSWFKEVAGTWTPPTVTSGANTVRAVGKFAFLYPPTLTNFYNILNSALKKVLNFREKFSSNTSLKVYVISSLAGGTGSGIIMDIFVIINQVMRKIDHNFSFQTILATPDALEGEISASDYPVIYTNTYATLKELFQFIRGSKKYVSYGVEGLDDAGKRIEVTSQHLPKEIFLITDMNDDCRVIVKTLPELASIVKSYLLTEVQTPLKTSDGTPKVQDAENTSHDGIGHGDMPTRFSSIGLVRFGIPYNEIRGLFANIVLLRAITEELEGEYNILDTNTWMTNHGIAEAGADQLQENIRKDKNGNIIRVSLDIKGDLGSYERTEIEKKCVEYKTKIYNSIFESKKPLIEKNAEEISKMAIEAIENDLDEIIKNRSIGIALVFIQALIEEIKKHSMELSNEMSANMSILQKTDKKVDQAITNVSEAANSGWYGRKKRLESALDSFGADLESYLNTQIVVWSQEAGDKLYKILLDKLDKFNEKWGQYKKAFISRKEYVSNKSWDLISIIDKMSDINTRGDGNRFSIIDSKSVKILYKDYIIEDVEASISKRARDKWRESNHIKDFMSTDSKWIDIALEAITKEVEDRIKELTLMDVLNRFYPEGDKQDKLMAAINSLGSPLYPTNKNYLNMTQGKTDQVIAIHKNIEEGFMNLYIRNVPPGQGISKAYFDTPYEVIIYTIKHGYTAHSLIKMNLYKAHYETMQMHCEKMKEMKAPHRPIHAWTFDEWVDIFPVSKYEEEAHKIFIIARAFAHLFDSGSSDLKKEFIYNKGNNFYINMGDMGDKKEKVGGSLEEAISNFQLNIDWQTKIKKHIEHKVSDLGTSVIRRRLEDEYIKQVLDPELERVTKTNDSKRIELISNLKKHLCNYKDKDLQLGNI